MTWARIAVLAAGIALGVAACSDRVASPSTSEVEREQLVARAVALKDRVVAAGHMSTEQRRELDDIMNDISSWQERTGRTDLVVSRSRPIMSPTTAALIGKAPGSSPSCLPCPPVSVLNGQICFLSYDGGCPPTPAPGDISLQVCVYACINTAPSPIKSR